MANINTQDILGDAYKGYGSAVGAIYSGVPTESLIGQTRFGAGSSLALGNIDAQAFLQQHPEFQEGFQNEIAKGGDPNKWLELAIQNATYINPASVPRGGGVSGTLAALTGAATGMETAANTAIREANLRDLAALGTGMAEAYRGANPELYAQIRAAQQLSQPTNYFGGLQQAISGAQTFGPVQAALIGQMPGVQSQAIQQGALGQQLYGQALGAAPTAASEIFRQRAQQMATSTGQLSPEELRNAQQSVREAYAARGLEMSNPAIAAEAMSRAAAVRDRQAQDIQQAAAFNQAYLSDLMASRGFATDIYGRDIGMQQANQAAALQAALSNQDVQMRTALANQAAQNQIALANREAAMAQQQQNIANLGMLGQAQQGEGGANRAYALNLIGAQQAAAYDPTRLLGAASNAPAMASNILGISTGYSPDLSNLYSGALSSAQDVAMTRFNASVAKDIAAKNRTAGLIGGALGAAGSAIGGPGGPALIGAIGNIFK